MGLAECFIRYTKAFFSSSLLDRMSLINVTVVDIDGPNNNLIGFIVGGVLAYLRGWHSMRDGSWYRNAEMIGGSVVLHSNEMLACQQFNELMRVWIKYNIP